MSCLGERLTALVDGELDHDERDRALAHLAVCRACRQEADMMRRIKDRLRSLAAPPADPTGFAPDLPDDDFLNRLRALGSQDEPPAGSHIAWAPPPSRPVPTAPRPVRPMRTSRPAAPGRALARSAVPGGWRFGYAAAVPARRRVPRRYLVAGAAAMVLSFGSASYAVGGRTEQPPPVVPAFDRLEAEHTLTNGLVPLPSTSPLPAAP